MTFEKIKNNMNAEGVRKVIKKIKAYLPEKYEDFKAIYYLKRVKENRSNEKKIVKVGFIVQAPEIWDKTVDVYNEMKKRENINPIILVVPPYNWAEGKLEKNFNDNFFLKSYPDAIRTIDDDGQLIDVQALGLDYVFYPRPYDQYLPLELRSSEMMKHSSCCYIPYSFAGADVFNECNTDRSFFRNMYMTFVESDYMRNIFRKKYKNRVQHFECLGYPCLEKFFGKREDLLPNTLEMLWTPRWSYDPLIGGSHFLEYKDFMLKFGEKFPNSELVFRPHPMMFDEMLRTNRMTKSEVESYLESLDKKNIKVDVGTPIDDALERADVLITDYSSLIIMFFLTGKPIVYCDSDIKFNEILNKIKECIYVVRDENELEDVLQNIYRGNDYLKSKRDQLIDLEFSIYREGSSRIVNRLLEDYFK